MARPRIYPDDLADRLIAEATLRLATQSLDTLGMRELAASQGTTTNAIYTLFGGKDDLVDHVVAAKAEELLNLQKAATGTMPTFASVLALSKVYREWALAHPELYMIIFVQRARRSGARTNGEQCRAASEFLTSTIAAAAENGELKTSDARQLALTLQAALHGWVLLEIQGSVADDPAQAEASFDQHIASVLVGPQGAA